MRLSCLRLLIGSLGILAWAAHSIAAETGAQNPSPRTWKSLVEWYRTNSVVPTLAPLSVQQSELRIQVGDDPRWADPGLDDTAWKVIDRSQVPTNAGIFWLRIRTRIQGPPARIPNLVLLNPGSAVEVFWNGVRTASTGVPGNSREEEIGGNLRLRFELPLQMADAGEHVVALRMSTYRRLKAAEGFTPFWLYTVPPDDYRALDAKLNLLPAMGVGSMLTLAIAAFVMWIVADRRLILLFLSGLCATAGLLVALSSAQFVWDYPASWLYGMGLARVILVVVAGSLVVAIAMEQLFPSWHRGWRALPLLLEGVIAVYGQPLGVNPLISVLWRVAFVGALVLSGWAVVRRRESAWPLLAGTAATYALFEFDPKHFTNSLFLAAFLPMLTGFIAAIAVRVRRERIQARDTRLMAARLEIELLKKSLQPHFLMNTLTALSQVVEEKPSEAVRLIEDLASELRSLARFSGEKQVSIEDELTLCRTHLRVMSARTELAWSIAAEGIDASALVPPALFLTLIENGFSHQRPSRDSTVFTLRAERTGHLVRYIFVSPGIVTSETTRVLGGTGLRYVRARLDESFHGAWKLSQGAVSGGWETIIELGGSAADGAAA